MTQRDSSTEECTRDSDDRVARRDVHEVFVPVEHRPDVGMVPFLSMVVRRGLHVVGARAGESGLDSCGKVSQVLPRCRLRSLLTDTQGMGAQTTQ